ncbi:MAG: hypothetical protein CM1200mP34_3770 [Verrucomicrobiales bacterium]|nr:MAG: hypothetical protein CM1200mP34_3770 [Verrucomicrobiales bacterium]
MTMLNEPPLIKLIAWVGSLCVMTLNPIDRDRMISLRDSMMISFSSIRRARISSSFFFNSHFVKPTRDSNQSPRKSSQGKHGLCLRAAVADFPAAWPSDR